MKVTEGEWVHILRHPFGLLLLTVDNLVSCGLYFDSGTDEGLAQREGEKKDDNIIARG